MLCAPLSSGAKPSQPNPPPPPGLGNGAERLRFQTLSGELIVTRGGDGRLAMDFPLNRAEASDKGYTAADGALVRALTGEAGVAEVLLNENLQMLLVVLRGGREELLALKPNPAELLAAQGSDLVGTIVTCKGRRPAKGGFLDWGREGVLNSPGGEGGGGGAL